MSEMFFDYYWLFFGVNENLGVGGWKVPEGVKPSHKSSTGYIDTSHKYCK